MEELRKIINVRLVDNSKDYIIYISKPSFVSRKISNNFFFFFAIHEIKAVLTLDKPIYEGFSILDLTYEFHYKYIKRKFNANFLFADRQSQFSL